PNGSGALAEITLQPPDEIVRKGLDGAPTRRHFALCYRVEHADGHAVAKTARELRRAEDGGGRRILHVFVFAGKLWSTADAARVEQPRAGSVVAIQIEAEESLPLEEEGPLLGKERLEGGEIHNGRIRLDL